MPPINSEIDGVRATQTEFPEPEKLVNEYDHARESPIKTAERADKYIRLIERDYLASLDGSQVTKTFEPNQTLHNHDGSTFTTDAHGRISSFTITMRKTRYTDITYDDDGMVIFFQDPYGSTHERLTANKAGPWKRTNVEPKRDCADKNDSYTGSKHDDVIFAECGVQFWNHKNGKMFSTTGDGSVLSISRTIDSDGIYTGFKTTFYPENGWQMDDRNVQHFTPTVCGKPAPEPGLVVDMYQARERITVEGGTITKVDRWAKPIPGWGNVSASKSAD